MYRNILDSSPTIKSISTLKSNALSFEPEMRRIKASTDALTTHIIDIDQKTDFHLLAN